MSSFLPRISVIIPCYNYGRYLGEAVASIQSQTIASWECLIIDDGSTDHTREVARSLSQTDSRVRYIHQPNSGLSSARNTGIRNAAGEYLQFLDADDLIEPRKFECQLHCLAHSSHIDVAYGGRRFFTADTADSQRVLMDCPDEMPKASGDGKALLSFLIRQNILSVHCPLVRARVVAEVGWFDETLRSCEDWDYWLRCAQLGKYFQFVSCGDDLALIRFHSASMSKNARRMIEATLQMRWKIDSSACDVEVAQYNQQQIKFWEDWLRRMDLAARDLCEHLPAGARFLVADQDEIKCFWPEISGAVSFPERDGRYFGAPVDDTAALDELIRQCESGVEYLVVAWPAFWWLDYYQTFASYLRLNFRCVLRNERLIVFNLREKP